ncbi:MAG: Tol-Pal system protein TolB [Actinomycetota bacterium]|jgi:TolB protein
MRWHSSRLHLVHLFAISLILSLLTSVSYAKPPCTNLQKSQLTNLQQQTFQTKIFLERAKIEFTKAKLNYEQQVAAGSQSGASRARIDMEVAQSRIDSFNRSLRENDRKVAEIKEKCDTETKATSSAKKKTCTQIENATLKKVVLQYQKQQDTKRLLNAFIKDAQTNAQNYSLTPSRRAQANMDASRYIQEYQVALTQEQFLTRQYNEVVEGCTNPAYSLPATFYGNWGSSSGSGSGSSSQGTPETTYIPQPCKLDSSTKNPQRIRLNTFPQIFLMLNRKFEFEATSLCNNIDTNLVVEVKSYTPTICDIENSTIVFIREGKCTITANQPGSLYFLPADQRSITTLIVRSEQVISFAMNSRFSVAESPVKIVANTNSGLDIEFESQTISICRVEGASVYFLDSGECVLKAIQSGDAYWLPSSYEAKFALWNGRIISHINGGAIYGYNNIIISDSDGANRKTIASGPGDDIAFSASRDGKKIAFQSNRDTSFSRDGTYQIYVVNDDGSNMLQITNGPEIKSHPVISPDGNLISFVKGEDKNQQIFVMNLDGSGEKQLTFEGVNSYPSWSPDGKGLVYTSSSTDNCDLWSMDLNGNNKTQITNTPKVCEFFPKWSPDGKSLAFMASNGGDLSIDVMNADGSGRFTLIGNRVGYYGLTWSPNSEELAFVLYNAGSWETFKISVRSKVLKVMPFGIKSYPIWIP